MSEPIGRALWRFAPAIYGPTVLFAVGEVLEHLAGKVFVELDYADG